jgi:YD repeat-containing protein
MANYTDTYAYNVKNQLTSYKGYDGYQQRYSYNAQGHMTKRESKGNASRQTLEAIATGEGESSAATSKDGGSDDDPDPYANASSSESWSTTTYVYDVTAPYYEVLTETTNDVTTAYDYGVERLSAYSGNAWNTQKTDYVYDGRGSVAQQSLSGVIVSTGLGYTGWLKSILAGASGVVNTISDKGIVVQTDRSNWDAGYLYFSVREPYPSCATGSKLVFGKVSSEKPLLIRSSMAENGVIFSDGVEQDFLEFNSGMEATITVAEELRCLVC